MITCPWCGTKYRTFQSNCSNCGGPIERSDEENHPSVSSENLRMPPALPRSISRNYVWRLVFTDGWGVAAMIFSFIGATFGLVGLGLTSNVLNAVVGLPFLLIGIAFFGSGVGVLIWRYQVSQMVVSVLREGEAAIGEITDVDENYSVTINGQHPWIIKYQFQVNGLQYEGKTTTLSKPAKQLQAGKAAYVLYLPNITKWSSIYPHP